MLKRHSEFAWGFNLHRMKIYRKKIKVNLLNRDIYIDLILSTYLILSKVTGTQISFINTPEQ